MEKGNIIPGPLPESSWGRGVAERLEAGAALRHQEEKKSWMWRDSSWRQEPSWSPCSMECTTRGSTRWQKSALTWGGHTGTQTLTRAVVAKDSMVCGQEFHVGNALMDILHCLLEILADITFIG